MASTLRPTTPTIHPGVAIRHSCGLPVGVLLFAVQARHGDRLPAVRVGARRVMGLGRNRWIVVRRMLNQLHVEVSTEVMSPRSEVLLDETLFIRLTLPPPPEALGHGEASTGHDDGYNNAELHDRMYRRAVVDS